MPKTHTETSSNFEFDADVFLEQRHVFQVLCAMALYVVMWHSDDALPSNEQQIRVQRP